MTGYTQDHWVSQPAAGFGADEREIAPAALDLKEAKEVFVTLSTIYMTMGNDDATNAMVNSTIDTVFNNNPLGRICSHGRYFKGQARTALALQLAAEALADFMGQSVDIIVNHINEYGSHEEL